MVNLHDLEYLALQCVAQNSRWHASALCAPLPSGGYKVFVAYHQHGTTNPKNRKVQAPHVQETLFVPKVGECVPKSTAKSLPPSLRQPEVVKTIAQVAEFDASMTCRHQQLSRHAVFTLGHQL